MDAYNQSALTTGTIMLKRILNRIWPISGFVQELVDSLMDRPSTFAVQLDASQQAPWALVDGALVIKPLAPEFFMQGTRLICSEDGTHVVIETLYGGPKLNWREQSLLVDAIDVWKLWFILNMGWEPSPADFAMGSGV